MPPTPYPYPESAALALSENFNRRVLATRHGIAYEVIPFATGLQRGEEYQQAVGVAGGFGAGLYDPITRARFEFPLPDYFQTTHMGWDPEGRRWFWEITPSWDSACPQKRSI
jgi:hypothetical protein